jgi:hypothetical protein
MHANLYLPNQVRKHGSLPKQNAYPGENCLKEINLNYRGKTNIPLQIATNISIKNHIKNYLTNERNLISQSILNCHIKIFSIVSVAFFLNN